jgi:hypothetical protein
MENPARANWPGLLITDAETIGDLHGDICRHGDKGVRRHNPAHPPRDVAGIGEQENHVNG